MSTAFKQGDRVRMVAGSGRQARKYAEQELEVAQNYSKTEKNPGDFKGHKPGHVLCYTTWRKTVTAWIPADQLVHVDQPPFETGYESKGETLTVKEAKVSTKNKEYGPPLNPIPTLHEAQEQRAQIIWKTLVRWSEESIDSHTRFAEQVDQYGIMRTLEMGRRHIETACLGDLADNVMAYRQQDNNADAVAVPRALRKVVDREKSAVLRNYYRHNSTDTMSNTMQEYRRDVACYFIREAEGLLGLAEDN